MAILKQNFLVIAGGGPGSPDDVTPAVLAGRGGALRWVGRLGDIVGKTHRVYACENLTLPGETVRRLDPKALVSLEASALAVFLFTREDVVE